MTLPALPPAQSTDWYGHYSGLDAAVRALQSAPAGQNTLADLGAVSLDSFAGATDDEKLTAAMSAIAADTYPRAIQLTNRRYDFAQADRVAFDGLKIMGPRGIGVPERNSQTKMPARVHLSMNGTWMTNGGSSKFGVSLWNLSFTGGSNACVIGTPTGGDFRVLHMRDISACNVRSVVGTQAQICSLTAATFDGAWDVSGFYNGPFHMGGADNVFWPDGMILTGAPPYLTGGNSTGQYCLWLDWMAKSYIGPLFITAEQGWGGIRVTGADGMLGPNTFIGMRVEGYSNPNQPCYGSLFRQEYGISVIRDSWFGFAMSDPSAMGHTPIDAGVIHHAGGQMLVSGCSYARATGVAETVPFVYTSSTDGDCIVKDIIREKAGSGSTGAWTGRPRVAKAAGTAENRITDSTVTLA